MKIKLLHIRPPLPICHTHTPRRNPLSSESMLCEQADLNSPRDFPPLFTSCIVQGVCKPYPRRKREGIYSRRDDQQCVPDLLPGRDRDREKEEKGNPVARSSCFHHFFSFIANIELMR